MCEGVGATKTVLRSGVNADGSVWKEYPVCWFCRGDMYVSSQYAELYQIYAKGNR